LGSILLIAIIGCCWSCCSRRRRMSARQRLPPPPPYRGGPPPRQPWAGNQGIPPMMGNGSGTSGSWENGRWKPTPPPQAWQPTVRYA
jgi:hypothetical protein